MPASSKLLRGSLLLVLGRRAPGPPGLPVTGTIEATQVELGAKTTTRIREIHAVDAFPKEAFAGEVTEIASEAEFTPRNVQTQKERVTPVFRVKITIANADGRLKPGMPADAVIETQGAP